MSRNVITRVILAFTSLPALIFVVLYAPFLYHLPIVILACAFGLGCSIELRRILEPDAAFSRTISACAAGLLPSAALYCSLLLGYTLPLLALWGAAVSISGIILFLLFALPFAFTRQGGSIDNGMRKMTNNVFYLMYPGFLTSAIVVILGARRNAGELLIVCMFIVFANDSFAWLVGVSIGRVRGIFAVSPQKSLEGVIAGMIGSITIALISPLVFPYALPRNWITLALLGLCCGFATVAGDLFESAVKRAAGVKDSGASVPGRGGMLDSFDSLLFAAPVFVIFTAAAGILY